MPSNLVRMLQVGVQRDMPNFSGVRAQEEELCQPLVWMTIAARMPSSWSCPWTMIFGSIFMSSVEKC
eukprot:5958551-Pleurochrysis_carterae.AAC.1